MDGLEDVNVGDLLVNEFRGGRNVVKVIRLTPTQIEVSNGHKYYKKNGCRIGCSDSFFLDDLRRPKDGEVEQIRKLNTVFNVCRKVKQVVDSYSITYEQAVKIKEILNL